MMLYMYFSDDVTILKSEFPYNVGEVNSPNYAFTKDKPKDWTRLSDISRYAKGAIVLSEDWGFYQHDGVDVNQMKIALEEMYSESRFRGASTITQQMVKNVFLSHSRTIWRKVHEIILSYKVEKYLSKAQILEVYLNCIEFGPGIYGIKKASYFYFKKHPRKLSAKESAFLAMLLPSPKKYSISYRRKKLSSFAKRRIKEILVKMRMGKVISSDQYLEELNRPFSWESF